MGESGRRVARAFLLALLGIGLVGMGGFGGRHEPGQPARDFRATFTDADGTRMTATRVVAGGDTSLDGELGRGRLRVPFDNIVLPGELSGGMRKRVALARALAVDPELILYDEPTADLDPILTEQIAQLVTRIRTGRGATQVIVTHNLPLARAIADRIAVLDQGRIAECSTPDTLGASGHPLTREFLRAAALGT